MFQEVVALAIVALAALNLVRIWGGSLKGDKGSSCGSCRGDKGCASKTGTPQPPAPQLVQLQVNLKSKGE